MVVDPNIKQKANDIRNKIYGKEVRESLASGLEAMSSDVVETVGRQDEVEGQFQNVIENTTDKDVISAPEIIAARDGEANLKARLDKEHQKVTAQLAHMESSPINKTKMKLWLKQPVTISAFGDSMTQGYITSTEQSETNYPKVLQDKLRYIYEYDDITVINRGYPGGTTEDALNRYGEVVADNPDLVIVMFGLNDRGQRITFENFESNLRQLITQFKDDGVEVMLLSNTPSIMGPQGDGYSTEYINVVRSISSEQGVDYVDVYKHFMDLWDNLQLSGQDYVPTIHLYDYTPIADIILKERLASHIVIEASEGKEIAMASPLIDRGSAAISINSNSKYKTYVHKGPSSGYGYKFGIYSDKPFFLTFEGISAPSAGYSTLRNFGEIVSTVDLHGEGTDMTKQLEPMFIDKPGFHFFEFKSGEIVDTFRLNGFQINHENIEGSWTPTIESTSGSYDPVYSLRKGYYVKKGNIVNASFEVSISELGDAIGGSVKITGLPFRLSEKSSVFSQSLSRFSNVGEVSNLGIIINPSSKDIYPFEIGNEIFWTLPMDNLKVGSRFSTTFTYVTDE